MCVCVLKDGGRRTVDKGVGWHPFLKQAIVLLCVFVCGKTCVFPDLGYADIP